MLNSSCDKNEGTRCKRGGGEEYPLCEPMVGLSYERGGAEELGQ